VAVAMVTAIEDAIRSKY